jgi:hypothetical protein
LEGLALSEIKKSSWRSYTFGQARGYRSVFLLWQ